jgi:hypothetical protein
MSAPVFNKSPEPKALSQVETCFATIIDSETLRTAQVSKSLLLYLWEHKGERLSEYCIAVDGLGRSSGFDPKGDATVRVQIARLRAKLKEFYAGEGDASPLRLHIPLGTHELQWSYDKPDPTWISALRRLVTRYPLVFFGTAVVCLAFGIVTLILLSRPAGGESAARKWGPVPQLWQAMVANGKSTAVVMPNSIGFQWTEAGITVLEPGVPAFDDWAKSPALKELAAKWGPPSLNQIHAITRHAIAGFKLLQFLNIHGESVELIESSDLPAEALARQNTILIGSPNTGVHIRSLMEKTNFALVRGASPSVVRNKTPLPGEQASFEETIQSRERRICPGIIVWLPKRPEGTQTLLLVGRWSTALASLLTSTEGLKMVEQELTKIGRPEGWEMVVEAEIQADTTILRSWPVAAREIPASYWK